MRQCLSEGGVGVLLLLHELGLLGQLWGCWQGVLAPVLHCLPAAAAAAAGAAGAATHTAGAYAALAAEATAASAASAALFTHLTHAAAGGAAAPLGTPRNSQWAAFPSTYTAACLRWSSHLLCAAVARKEAEACAQPVLPAQQQQQQQQQLTPAAIWALAGGLGSGDGFFAPSPSPPPATPATHAACLTALARGVWVAAAEQEAGRRAATAAVLGGSFAQPPPPPSDTAAALAALAAGSNAWQGVVEALGVSRGGEEAQLAALVPFSQGGSAGGAAAGEGAAWLAGSAAGRCTSYEVAVGVLLAEPPGAPTRSGAQGLSLLATVAPLASKGPASGEFVGALLQVLRARAPPLQARVVG